MIHNIVFDVGKVLFDYHPEIIIQNLIPHRNDGDFFVRELHNSNIWQQLDEGLLTPEEAIATINDKHSEDISNELKTILNNYIHELPPIKEVIALFIRLSKTHKTYLLTNFQKAPFKQLRKAYPFLNLSSGTIVSAEEKTMKPSHEIYKLLLKRFSINAKETIFIDDRAENIAAAQKLGINGIVFHSYQKLEQSLTPYNLK
jgi:HAD superfamily hydrolase (TIGR01509 family)